MPSENKSTNPILKQTDRSSRSSEVPSGPGKEGQKADGKNSRKADLNREQKSPENISQGEERKTSRDQGSVSVEGKPR